MDVSTLNCTMYIYVHVDTIHNSRLIYFIEYTTSMNEILTQTCCSLHFYMTIYKAFVL